MNLQLVKHSTFGPFYLYTVAPSTPLKAANILKLLKPRKLDSQWKQKLNNYREKQRRQEAVGKVRNDLYDWPLRSSTMESVLNVWKLSISTTSFVAMLGAYFWTSSI